MVRLNEKHSHMFFIDSRGSWLQSEINKLNKGKYLGVREYKGATLHQLSKKASKYCTGVDTIDGSCRVKGI